MIKTTPRSVVFRRLASVLVGLSFAIVTGFYLFTVLAKQEEPVEQNLTLGRLAVSLTVGTQSGPLPAIATANADGTGRSTITSFPPGGVEPSWSPDGTKIAFVVLANQGEIFVMNSNGTNQVNLTNTQAASEADPQWSVTGKIVYERENQIWVMNADGTNQMQFPGITQPTPIDPAWSPDGARIAFISGGEVWKINADGTGEQRVTTNASPDTSPSWSADGTKIVFAKGGSGIAVVNADGTNEANLTTVSGDSRPVWSPDGTTIAFVRSLSPSGIFVMDVTGGNQTRVLANTETFPIGESFNDPAWQPIAQAPNTFSISGRITSGNVGLSGVIVNLSGLTNASTTTDAVGNYQFSGLTSPGDFNVSPSQLNYYFTPPVRRFTNLTENTIADFNGSRVCVGIVCAQNGKIAFVHTNEIFLMNEDGTNQVNLTNNPAADNFPSWSPNGTRIAFTTARDGNNEIYWMNANGSGPTRLTNNAADDSESAYSPDGNSIVFTSSRDGNPEIYKMNADGTNQVRLTMNTDTDQTPSFSPDGRKIVFRRVQTSPPGQFIYTMNADGSNQQPILGPAAFAVRPSYSPDGTKIILGWGDDITAQNIYIMNADGTGRVPAGFGRSWPSYSPDGAKVVHNCCFGPGTPTPNGLFVTTLVGLSQVRLTNTVSDDTAPDWQPLPVPRRVQFDFDGDGKSDPAIFRPSTRDWWYLSSLNGAQLATEWGRSSDLLAPADYDGDLKTDFAIWRPQTGNFLILNSFDNTIRLENFGLDGDIPTGGDWDGDSKADLAVYRPGAPGVFYYRGTMGNPQRNITFVPWGTTGDKPFVGDFDGDGRTDAAIYRGGQWWIRYTATGQSITTNFGLPDDRVTPADYDGDGKTDIAVFRNGVWYLMKSTEGITSFQFGIAGDSPTPADYDGDGRADPAVFRNGTWWILKSTSGAEAVQFGLGTDVPVHSTYVR